MSLRSFRPRRTRAAATRWRCSAATLRRAANVIELCAPSPLDAKTGYLVYRFGALDKDGIETSVEFEYPPEDAGSLKRFYAATYTYRGVYTKSVRFVSGNFGYTVFTHARGAEDLDAGVEVLDRRRRGKRSTILCSERPRFYIWELQGIVPAIPIRRSAPPA